MREGWQVGRLGAVPFYFHPGALWFLMLVIWLLAVLFFPLRFPLLPASVQWLLAAVATLLLTLTIIAHEVGHVWMARRRGIESRGITLFSFGAVAWFEEEPGRPVDQGLIALAGPAINLGVVLGAQTFWALLRDSPSAPLLLSAELAHLVGQLNLLLLLFNMLPAYPLDGGRLLHALLWALLGDGEKGMRVTARAGQLFAALLLVSGVAIALVQRHGPLLFAAGILAWFLYRGSASSLQRLEVRYRLNRLSVRQIMWQQFPLLHPAESLQEASMTMMLQGEPILPVIEEGRFLGLLSHTDLQTIAREERPHRTVRELARPASQLPSLSPEQQADVALWQMERARLVTLPVVEEGRLVGLLRQHDLVRASIRQERVS